MRLVIPVWVCAGLLSMSLSAHPQETAGQSSDPKQRAKAVREYAKQGTSELIPKLIPYLDDADAIVRIEAVKELSDRGRATLEPLIKSREIRTPKFRFARPTASSISICRDTSKLAALRDRCSAWARR